MSRREFSWPPDGWQARRGPRPGVTTIQGWDSRQGLVVAAAVGGLLVPLLLAVGGVWETLAGFLACLVLGLGLGYRLVVAPEGILYKRTWYGLPWNRRRLPLQSPVSEWSTFEQPEGEGIVLGGEQSVTLPASKRNVVALRQAVEEAILWAGTEQASSESGA